MQKLLFLSLCAVLALFQYELWYGKGSIYDSYRLNGLIAEQVKDNQKLQERNNNVLDHLEELKGSPALMEARSRRELGLVKANEMLVNFPSDSKESIPVNL